MEAEQILSIIKNNLVFIISFSILLILYIVYLCYQMYQDYKEEKKERKLISACPDYWTNTQNGCKWNESYFLPNTSTDNMCGDANKYNPGFPDSKNCDNDTINFNNDGWGLSTIKAYKNKCAWLKNNNVSWDTLEAALC